MAKSAFDDAVWIPGEPLDPGTDSMQNKELTDRLMFLEKAMAGLQIGDLPMGALMKTLEQSWLPDPDTLFASGAISNDSLGFSIYHGQIAAAGGLTLSSDTKLTAVRNSAGNYTLTYPPYKAVPAVTGTPGSAVVSFRRANKTVSSVDFINATGDTDIDFVVIGK